MSKIVTSSGRPKRGKRARGIGRAARSDVAESLGNPVRSAALTWLGGKDCWAPPAGGPDDVEPTLASSDLAYGAVTFLVSQLNSLTKEEIAKMLGISTRTLRRRRGTPQKRMPATFAARAWTLAETMAKASEIFGGTEEAKGWISRPAMGLDGRRPVELLQCAHGAKQVHDFLGRLEYGVYC